MNAAELCDETYSQSGVKLASWPNGRGDSREQLSLRGVIEDGWMHQFDVGWETFGDICFLSATV